MISDSLDRRRACDDLLRQRREIRAGDDQATPDCASIAASLRRRESRIERVADRADAHDRVPGLDMRLRIPGERRNAIAETDAEIAQHRGDAQAARLEVRVAHAIGRRRRRAPSRPAPADATWRRDRETCRASARTPAWTRRSSAGFLARRKRRRDDADVPVPGLRAARPSPAHDLLVQFIHARQEMRRPAAARRRRPCRRASIP